MAMSHSLSPETRTDSLLVKPPICDWKGGSKTFPAWYGLIPPPGNRSCPTSSACSVFLIFASQWLKAWAIQERKDWFCVKVSKNFSLSWHGRHGRMATVVMEACGVSWCLVTRKQKEHIRGRGVTYKGPLLVTFPTSWTLPPTSTTIFMSQAVGKELSVHSKILWKVGGGHFSSNLNQCFLFSVFKLMILSLRFAYTTE